MNSFVPTSANDFIEHQLDARLFAVAKKFNADAVGFVGPLLNGIDDAIRTEIENLVQSQQSRNSTIPDSAAVPNGMHPRLVMLITTGGGSIETVARIVDVLRRHYVHISFVVPNGAYSAGTVLVMSGDEIYMDYYSRLGPIDPQINRSGRLVPALGYLKQWERLVAKAQSGALTVAEAQLMISGFDQAELYQYEQARDLSITLLKQWLVNYKFKNWTVTETSRRSVTPAMRADRAEAIAVHLNDTDRWHSHGFGISMDVLHQEINLQINDLEKDQEMRTGVRVYDSLLSDYLVTRGFQGVLHTVGRFRPLM